MFCFPKIGSYLMVANSSTGILNFLKYKCSMPAKGPPWNILFFGTDRFALRSLKALWAKYNTGTTISDLGVVTKPGTVVEEFAKVERLDIYRWPVDQSMIESKYHIGMVVSFGKMIPEEIINAFPLGCINVHASLLPKWRGAAPIIYSILSGDTETGITIMRIHPHKFDVGEIVRQYRISIDKDEKTPSLEERLGEAGASLLMECIRDMPRCLQAAVKQPKENISYAHKVSSQLAKVNWSELNSESVYNLYRAVSHLHTLSTTWCGEPVRIHEVSPVPRNRPTTPTTTLGDTKSALSFLNVSPASPAPPQPVPVPAESPGTFKYSKPTRTIQVVCADGHFVSVNKVTIKGKTMSGKDFYNGFMSKTDKGSWKFGT